jgi:hypothetical protein
MQLLRVQNCVPQKKKKKKSAKSASWERKKKPIVKSPAGLIPYVLYGIAMPDPASGSPSQSGAALPLALLGRVLAVTDRNEAS